MGFLSFELDGERRKTWAGQWHDGNRRRARMVAYGYVPRIAQAGNGISRLTAVAVRLELTLKSRSLAGKYSGFSSSSLEWDERGPRSVGQAAPRPSTAFTLGIGLRVNGVNGVSEIKK